MSDFTHHTTIDDISIKDQSLADFMAKPQLIYNNTWTTSSVANADLTSFAVGTTMTSIAYWTNKIQGYHLCRGTAVVTVVINANPFQQGKLLLHFIPGNPNPLEVSMRNTLLSSKRMHPGVEIDCRDSGAVMKIPYISRNNWYGLIDDKVDWGTFYLTVLSPLKVGSAGEIDTAVTIYLHFEDFEFAAPIVPQMTMKVASKRYSAHSTAESTVLSGGGTISKGLSMASAIAGALGTVPTLAPVAAPAAWVFRGLSSLASHFGWSKADLNSVPVQVLRSQNRFSATSDGTNCGYPLALISDNRATVTTANSLTDEDEMSFEYLKRIPTLIYSFDWTTANANGAILKNQEIDPFQLRETGTKVVAGHTMTYAVGPPIYYLSNIFSSYRGSVKLTIKFVKTQFHSGRLQVVFTPLLTGSITTQPSITNSTLSLREIVDIRNGSEFTLDLPYLKSSNYIPCGTTLGMLQISVLNELRAPETCSQNIQCLIYASGGDDFEFEAFTNMGLIDNNSTIYNNYTRVFSPQMEMKGLVDEPIGNSKILPLRNDYAQQSYGEQFASVKQLLARMSHVYYRNVMASTGSTSPVFLPYGTGVITLNATTGAPEGPNIGGDLFSFVANMYNFMRGGMSVQILPANTGDVSAALYRFNLANQVLDLAPCGFGLRGSLPWANLTQKALCSGIWQSDGGQSVQVVDVPWYYRWKVAAVSNSGPSTSLAEQNLYGVQFSSSSSSTLGSYGLMRSVKDDFQFSYFMGCPPVCLSYV